VPQSICVRYGLPIGAWMSPIVLVLMYVMGIVAWPTAKLLDYLLGEDHGTTYKKAGLKTLVTLHQTLGPNPEDQLNEDEVTIITAVLDLKAKAVGSIMTPMDDVFTMSSDTVLDEKMMENILSAGYSRIPIHTPDNEENFVGMLLVKMLITYDPEDAAKVNDFALATLPETRPETSCLDIINFFQEGKSHMVLGMQPLIVPILLRANLPQSPTSQAIRTAQSVLLHSKMSSKSSLAKKSLTSPTFLSMCTGPSAEWLLPRAPACLRAPSSSTRTPASPPMYRTILRLRMVRQMATESYLYPSLVRRRCPNSSFIDVVVVDTAETEAEPIPWHYAAMTQRFGNISSISALRTQQTGPRRRASTLSRSSLESLPSPRTPRCIPMPLSRLLHRTLRKVALAKDCSTLLVSKLATESTVSQSDTEP
jgi:hypothetical protein